MHRNYTRSSALAWLTSTLLAVSGCSREAGRGAEPEADAGADAGSATDDELAVGDRVFDSSRVATLALEVSDADLATLRADADKPMNSDDFTYVPARLTFDGEDYEQVGLRVKGNSSRTMAQGDALPFKLDMNRFVAGQRLDGLSKINLHNNVNNPAAMNEYLSYGAFRAFGIAASRTGWADVTLNGQSLGVYMLVEQVNGKMLDRWFDDGSADLYKPESPAGSLSYLGDSIDAYTNVGYEADNDTDHATFLRMVKTIDEAEVGSWDEVIEVDSVLAYFAGNVALGNWDTYVGMNHNFYLFEATPGRMVMLPWDMNLSQGTASSICPAEQQAGGLGGLGGAGGGAGFDPANLPMGGGGFTLPEGFTPPAGFTPPTDGSTGFPGGGGAPAMGGIGGFPGSGGAPLHDGLMTDQVYFERYREVLRSFLSGPGSADSLNARIDAAVETLGARASSAAVDNLRETIAARVSALENALTTTTTCPAASAGATLP